MPLNRSIIAVLMTVVINMTGVGLFWPILPSLIEQLGGGDISYTAAVLGAVSVVFALMQFLFAPVMGALSDRYGRRPVMLVCLTGMGFDSLFLAFAPNLWWVFVGRAVGGVLGATFSVANAYMADISTPENRAAAFGMVGAAFGLGFILGPLIGGLLGENDPRLPVLFAAGLAFANVGFAYFFLEESLPAEMRSARPLFSTNIISTIAWLRLIPIVAVLAVAHLVANSMQRGLESVWVIFTGVQYGWGVREAGISLGIVGISYVVVQGFAVKPIVAALGEAKTIIFGFALSATMFVILSFNTSGLIGYLGILPHVLGWGTAGPALQALASRHVEPEQQGYLQGALTSLSGLAAIIGPAIATGSLAWFTSDVAPFAFPGAFFLLGGLLLYVSAVIAGIAGRLAAPKLP